MVINGSCSTNMCDRAMATASASICVMRQLSFNFFIHGLGGMAPWPPFRLPLSLKMGRLS